MRRWLVGMLFVVACGDDDFPLAGDPVAIPALEKEDVIALSAAGRGSAVGVVGVTADGLLRLGRRLEGVWTGSTRESSAAAVSVDMSTARNLLIGTDEPEVYRWSADGWEVLGAPAGAGRVAVAFDVDDVPYALQGSDLFMWNGSGWDLVQTISVPASEIQLAGRPVVALSWLADTGALRVRQADGTDLMFPQVVPTSYRFSAGTMGLGVTYSLDDKTLVRRDWSAAAGWTAPCESLVTEMGAEEGTLLDADETRVLFEAAGTTGRHTYLMQWSNNRWTPLAKFSGATAVGLMAGDTVARRVDATFEGAFVPDEQTVPSGSAGCDAFEGDPDDPASGFPQTLTETGCYASVEEQRVVSGAVAYSVKSPLWSDGALKRRYIVIPGGEAVGYQAYGSWNVPVGTVVIKEFLTRAQEGDVDSALVPMETRFLVRQESGWEAYSYIWNESGTEGTLRDNTEERVTFSVLDAAGGPMERSHIFPSRTQCFECHGFDQDNMLLGVESYQLNRSFDYGGVALHQFDVWAARLGVDIPNDAPGMVHPEDTAQSVDARMRSYLQANCAHCHPSTNSFCGDMRYETSLSDSEICVQVAPQDPAGSLLYTVSVEEFLAPAFPDAPHLMPPLAVDQLNPILDELMTAWIEDPGTCAP